MRLPISRMLASVIVALVLASPAAAGPSSPAAPLFGGYWQGFVDHWKTALLKQNGIILAALGVGAVSLFIITRGKWHK